MSNPNTSPTPPAHNPAAASSTAPFSVPSAAANPQSPADNSDSILNPQTVTIDAPGSIRVRLPALALAHILSLAGVCGGAYTITRTDAQETKSETAQIRREIRQLQADRMESVERLARMEEKLDLVLDDIRDGRRYAAGRVSSRANADAARRRARAASGGDADNDGSGDNGNSPNNQP